MTDKRFTEIISTQKVIDNKTGKEYDCLIDDDLLKLLNELHEENEQLKQQIKELQLNNDIEWLKNNTVWEQMPTNHKSVTKTKFER